MESGLVVSGATPRLTGKIAIITGGAQGIGESIARLFTKHGAKVIIVDILDDLGQSVCETIGFDMASYIHCDVSIESEIKNAVDFAIDKHGKLDIMINNAAIIDKVNRSILENEQSEFDLVMSVNVTGVFLGTKHAARVMIPARSGSIISLGSVSSTIGGITTHAYTTSKHAIVGLAKNVAAELGEFGIRVNCLSPYFIPTSLPTSALKDHPDLFSNVYSNLKGVVLQKEDVASAALFLASDESKYISGHNLALDGGFTTINPSVGLYSPGTAT